MTPREGAVRADRSRGVGLNLRLGEILLRRGVISVAELAALLEIQKATGARLGEISVAREIISARELAEAIADQAMLRFIDIACEPALPELAGRADLDAYLRWCAIPWRSIGGTRVFAIADPADGPAMLADLAVSPPFALFVVAEGRAIEAALAVRFADDQAARAVTRVAFLLSARSGASAGQKLAFIIVGALLAAGFAATPRAAATWLVLALTIVVGGSASLRVAILFAALRGRMAPCALAAQGGSVARLDARRSLPTVTLLVPLFGESESLPMLLESLVQIDYPPELIDVNLLLEADDAATRAALADLPVPPWIRALTVPPGAPRTKPRAMNYALDFARGEIVGIYDAEDQPDPRQIRKVVDAFRAAPREVACVQARLGYYNIGENWLSRCFAIEYAIWFEVLLAGLRGLSLPIPLGGTSVFFRRAALVEVGGWDAHNVTEDADLGMRFARLGYRVDLVDSTTLEEANCRVVPWIRQRSRWIKGYMQTWAVHSRHPLAAIRAFGPWGFAGMQMLFLGSVIAYLGQPVFMASLIWWIAQGESGLALFLPHAGAWAIFAVLLAGQGAMYVTAFVALRRRGEGRLIPWMATLPLYWPLGALAAYKALLEIVVAPFYWDKTRHGVSCAAKRARRAALARAAENE